MEDNLGNTMECDRNEEGGLRVDNDIYIPPPPMVFREVDTNGPRLMINKIINKNFKSYAGTKIVGPFHKVAMSHLCVHIFVLFNININ